MDVLEQQSVLPQAPAPPPRVAGDLAFADLGAALAAGWRDFLAMPQFGLLLMLTMLPLQMLSGGVTPRESMPVWVQHLMSLSPTTHFTELAQAILYRGGGLEVVWSSFLALILIGAALFAVSLGRFRKTIALMQ